MSTRKWDRTHTYGGKLSEYLAQARSKRGHEGHTYEDAALSPDFESDIDDEADAAEGFTVTAEPGEDLRSLTPEQLIERAKKQRR